MHHTVGNRWTEQSHAPGPLCLFYRDKATDFSFCASFPFYHSTLSLLPLLFLSSSSLFTTLSSWPSSRSPPSSSWRLSCSPLSLLNRVPLAVTPAIPQPTIPTRIISLARSL